jgi:HEAT repeat protein
MPLFGPPDVDELEAERDVKGLIKALGHEKDRDVREGAVWALSMIGDTRAVELIHTHVLTRGQAGARSPVYGL